MNVLVTFVLVSIKLASSLNKTALVTDVIVIRDHDTCNDEDEQMRARNNFGMRPKITIALPWVLYGMPSSTILLCIFKTGASLTHH